MWKRCFDVSEKGKVMQKGKDHIFLLRNAFLSSETANYILGLEKECSQKMTTTTLVLIHSCDSDNKVTNGISDCSRIAITSVVEECGPTHRQKHASLEKVGFIFTNYSFIY